MWKNKSEKMYVLFQILYECYSSNIDFTHSATIGSLLK